jgi:hypothetical protein
MTKDEILSMASQAGIVALGDVHIELEELERFAALVAAKEREAIAKWHDKSDAGSTWDSVVQEKIRTGGYLND